MTTRERSVSFRALSKRGRRAFKAIMAEFVRTGADEVVMTSTMSANVRELTAVGFIVAEVRGPRRGTITVRLSDAWRDIADPVEAKRVALAARAARIKRTIVRVADRRRPVEAQPEEPAQPDPRQVSLPAVPWPTPRGLQLLEEGP